MGEFYGWVAGGLGVVFTVLVAWLSGRSKGKAVAEKKAEEERTRDMINATKVAAQRETTVSREAAHVDQTVNNSSNSDVDSELLNKWTRK